MGQFATASSFFLVVSIVLACASAQRTIGERCAHVDNQPDSCEASQYLVCGHDDHICKCRGDMTWIAQYGRCVYRIDRECISSQQGGNLPGCPPNAFCDSNNRKCKCQQSYRPLRDRKGCTNEANQIISKASGIGWISLILTAVWTSSKAF